MKLSTKLFRRRSYRWGVVCFLMCFLFFNASVSIVTAGPEGAQVVNGQVTIQQSGSNTAITASDKAIINYSSFDIAQPETVRFIQPGSTASVLNRILSANPTNINGTLLANGRVFFVNPAGVYFGNGATINVNQLVASGLNMSNADFINGHYNFAGGNGAVINNGDISAQQVYLIGKQVTNSGNISCPAGYVVMAAGDRVFLGEPGSDIVLDVEGTSLSESADAAAPEVGVLNEGTVEAAGGIIALAAAGDIYSQAISNVGSLSTSADTGDAGQIKLAAAGGEVVNTGTIEASGSEGGQVAMEGARVGQFGTIHADGTTGDGGTVNLWADEVVALSPGSLTTANAGTNGNGGEVMVFSPDAALLWADALIEAKGGSESGDGGFVEISGIEYVMVDGSVDRRAPNGEAGLLYIDPTDLTINDAGTDDTFWTGDAWADDVGRATSQIDIDTLETHIASGNTSIDTTTGGGGGSGNITVNAGRDIVDGGSGNSLSLTGADITFTSGVNFSSNGNLDVLASGAVDIDSGINLTGGNFTSTGTTFDNTGGVIATAGGSVDIQNTGNVTVGAAINAGVGTVTIDGGGSPTGSINGAGLITASTVDLDAATGIGNTTALELAASTITADNATSGNVDIDNTLTGAVTVNTLTTSGGGTILFENTGAGGVSFGTVSTTTDGSPTAGEDDITLSSNNGDLTIATSVTAGGAGDIAVTSSAGDVTLGDVDGILTAGSGSVTVRAPGGNIRIADDTDAVEVNAGETVTIAAMATLKGGSASNGNLDVSNATALEIEDTGAGNIDIRYSNGDSVDIDNGYILNNIDLDEEDSPSFSYTTNAGDITVNTVNLGSKEVTIDAKGGAITDGTGADTVANITASNAFLEASTGIGGTGDADIDTDVATLTAHVTGTGGIYIEDTDAITLTNVDTVTGDIIVTSTGAMTATVVDTTTSGDITLNSGGDLTIATSVTAGGAGDIAYNTTTSGNIVLTGTTTAAADDVTMNSIGSINGAGLVTAAVVDLNAATGIGNTTALELAAGTITADNATSGNVDIDNTLTGAVTVNTLTTSGGGTILFENTGAGGVSFGAVSTTSDGSPASGEDDITLSSDSGDLTIATSVTAGGAGDIAYNTTTGGNIVLTGTTTAAADNVTMNSIGSINGTGLVTAAVVSMTSNADLNMSNYNVANPGGTDLSLSSTGGTVTVANSAADDWQSISAAALGDVVLLGDGDITANAMTSTGGDIKIETTGVDSNLLLKGDLTADAGGVSLISETGSIYTPDSLNPAARVLDVSISGYSAPAPGVGVDLDPDMPGSGEAAIVIRTQKDLILGDSAILNAGGTYTPGTPAVDDRSSVGFDDSIVGGGDPIDVAIYLRSNRVEPGGPNGHVTVNSKVMMGDNGTMVVDAGEKVTFGGAFNQSEFNQSQRLEVVSRKSETLDEVITNKRLPYADDPEAIRTWFETSTGHFAGAYVLRGVKTLLAEVLALTNPVPLVPPRPLEPELRGEVEGPDTEALAQLLSDLGIGVQPYMTEAYADSLSTDLRLYKAAEKLQELMPVLEDVNGIHIAGLRETVAEYFPTLDVLSDERMDSFAQVLASHKGDETNYDLAGQCIFALTEYVNILGTDIGWPVETSVEFVMGRYVPRLTENDEIRIAVIQMHLQKEL